MNPKISPACDICPGSRGIPQPVKSSTAHSLTSRTYWFPSPKQSKRCGSTWTTYGSNSLPNMLHSISKANNAPARQTAFLKIVELSLFWEHLSFFKLRCCTAPSQYAALTLENIENVLSCKYVLFHFKTVSALRFSAVSANIFLSSLSLILPLRLLESWQVFLHFPWLLSHCCETTQSEFLKPVDTDMMSTNRLTAPFLRVLLTDQHEALQES